ncbi:hypothetical protein ACF06P_39740 [Streptomyces sp. NPDC015684]|uniref:hypothetical protein n=1 Tax=Streptomyces sp. NPDC015684 TaxID=3364963 RepID=UPI0036F77B56
MASTVARSRDSVLVDAALVFARGTRQRPQQRRADPGLGNGAGLTVEAGGTEAGVALVTDRADPERLGLLSGPLAVVTVPEDVVRLPGGLLAVIGDDQKV